MLRRAKSSIAARVYHVNMRKASRWMRLIGRVQVGVVLVAVALGLAGAWANVLLAIGGSLIIWFVTEELAS